VVDDHPVVRQAVAVLVGSQSDMTLAAEASNGREAIQQFRAHRPDVTLMDLQMPEMSGIDALVAILAESPDAKIIVLTTPARSESYRKICSPEHVRLRGRIGRRKAKENYGREHDYHNS
jgi:DNA-binding NarL/FixJ family response regulator